MAFIPDARVQPGGDHALMTYAVVVSADDGPEQPGRLELEPDCLRFSGGHPVRYSDLGDVYVERRSGGSQGGRPALVLISHTGERLRITSVEGLGALYELAEAVVESRGKTAS
jgi:hypothetical protein